MGKNKKILNSVIIEDFLKLIGDANKNYDSAFNLMREQDKITQDILHKFELDDLTASDKSKLGTVLKTNRKDRRYYKDVVDSLQPIIDFLNEAPIHIQTINKLKQTLGKVRKADEYLLNRKYYPRVLKEEENE